MSSSDRINYFTGGIVDSLVLEASPSDVSIKTSIKFKNREFGTSVVNDYQLDIGTFLPNPAPMSQASIKKPFTFFNFNLNTYNYNSISRDFNIGISSIKIESQNNLEQKQNVTSIGNSDIKRGNSSVSGVYNLDLPKDCNKEIVEMLNLGSFAISGTLIDESGRKVTVDLPYCYSTGIKSSLSSEREVSFFASPSETEPAIKYKFYGIGTKEFLSYTGPYSGPFGCAPGLCYYNEDFSTDAYNEVDYYTDGVFSDDAVVLDNYDVFLFGKQDPYGAHAPGYGYFGRFNSLRLDFKIPLTTGLLSETGTIWIVDMYSSTSQEEDYNNFISEYVGIGFLNGTIGMVQFDGEYNPPLFFNGAPSGNIDGTFYGTYTIERIGTLMIRKLNGYENPFPVDTYSYTDYPYNSCSDLYIVNQTVHPIAIDNFTYTLNSIVNDDFTTTINADVDYKIRNLDYISGKWVGSLYTGVDAIDVGLRIGSFIDGSDAYNIGYNGVVVDETIKFEITTTAAFNSYSGAPYRMAQIRDIFGIDGDYESKLYDIYNYGLGTIRYGINVTSDYGEEHIASGGTWYGTFKNVASDGTIISTINSYTGYEETDSYGLFGPHGTACRRGLSIFKDIFATTDTKFNLAMDSIYYITYSDALACPLT